MLRLRGTPGSHAWRNWRNLLKPKRGRCLVTVSSQFRLLVSKRMKKPDLAKRLARRSGLSVGEAADQLDRTVQQIVQQLRHGREARLPGLGKFKPKVKSHDREH
jgi:hypothetical protein